MLFKGNMRVEIIERVFMRMRVKHKCKNVHACGGKVTWCIDLSTFSNIISSILWIKKLAHTTQ